MMGRNTKQVDLLEVLIEQLEELDDYRDKYRLIYTLEEVLFLVFCGLMCNCQSYEEIVDFGELKITWLRKFLPYQAGIPSHDTLGRVLNMLNTKQLEKVLAGLCNYSIQLPVGTIINIDGKRISRSVTIKEQQSKKVNGRKQAINMVNVYCSMFNSCLASVRVSGKSVEKSALDDILEMLDLSYCLITLDAGYCSPDVAKQIVDTDADYLIGLKANQPKLYATCKAIFVTSTAVKEHTESLQDSHGRLEQRTCSILNLSDLEEVHQKQYNSVFKRWVGLKCLIMVFCKRTIKAKNKTSNETRFYICSSLLTATKANKVIRGHWGIENSLHCPDSYRDRCYNGRR